MRKTEFFGRTIVVGCAAMLLATSAQTAMAFELTPIPTRGERLAAKRSSGVVFRSLFPVVDFGLHTFSNSVHESITNLAYECPAQRLEECSDPDLDFASTGILAGVRWNDDPPFQFAQGQGRYAGCPTGTPPPTISFALSASCWLAHFKDISAQAEASPKLYTGGDGTMLARTHFGDLQFLHAMAAVAGTDPQITRAKVMMWAEFAWRVQSHEADHIDALTKMGAVPVTGLSDHFPAREQRTVSDLFTVGRPWLRLQLRDMVFGSLLHMVEDSFAGGHVTRRGREVGGCSVPEIVEFHTYAGQDKDAHKDRDGFARANFGLSASGTSVVGVLRELIRLREADQAWSDVEPYFRNCVFGLATNAVPASTAVAD